MTESDPAGTLIGPIGTLVIDLSDACQRRDRTAAIAGRVVKKASVIGQEAVPTLYQILTSFWRTE